MITRRGFYTSVQQRAEWSFSSASRSETSEVTHCYHKYPAKFIPQLARSLLKEYSKKGEVVWDPFCGSGTLNLEAFRIGRDSLGSDINPTAVLIARAKTTPLDPQKLANSVDELLERLEFSSLRSQSFYEQKGILNGNVSLLKKWYSNASLRHLANILWVIRELGHPRRFRDFEVCALSSILKRASFWLNDSVKPQIDPKKIPAAPLIYFESQLQLMQKRNHQLFEEVQDPSCRPRIFRHNSMCYAGGFIGKVDSIITSPPYVVSYDYSDIFRLSTHFLFYHQASDIFRRRFIGTRLNNGTGSTSPTGTVGDTIKRIDDTSIRNLLGQYYSDMQRFLSQARRTVRRGGKLVMVIGDTELRGVSIPNVFLIADIAIQLGWRRIHCIERNVPLKILPTTRDRETGRFSDGPNPSSSKRYSKEYILAMRNK